MTLCSNPLMGIKDWDDLIIHIQNNYPKYFMISKSPEHAALTYTTLSIYFFRKGLEKRLILPPRSVDMKDHMVKSPHDMYAM